MSMDHRTLEERWNSHVVGEPLAAVRGNIGQLIREATSGAVPGHGSMLGPCYQPLEVEDSELAAEGFAPVGQRCASRLGREILPSPTSIRSDFRAVSHYALAFGALAGVALIWGAVRQASGHPRSVNGAGTVGLLAQPGDGRCFQYDGHLHPDGRKCCSPKCVVGGNNYCGAADCWRQGDHGVLNCCSNSTGVPVCPDPIAGAVLVVSPCMLPITTTTTIITTTAAIAFFNPAAFTTTSTMATTTMSPPVVTTAAKRRKKSEESHPKQEEKREDARETRKAATTVSPPAAPSATSTSSRTWQMPVKVDGTWQMPVKPLCRSQLITCDHSYYGVVDSSGTICCDRACGQHCGATKEVGGGADCKKAIGGEAMCCPDAIKKNGIFCNAAGISPCILEPACPPWVNK